MSILKSQGRLDTAKNASPAGRWHFPVKGFSEVNQYGREYHMPRR